MQHIPNVRILSGDGDPAELSVTKETIRLAFVTAVPVTGRTRTTRRYTGFVSGYLEVGAVTKRLVDVDDELLVAAQRISGENTIRGTVQRALELLISQSSQREAELRRRWEDLGDALADLQDDAVRHQAWS